MMDFDTIVRGLVKIGVSQKDAERMARRKLSLDAPEQPAKDGRVLEKAEQQEVAKRFRAFGFKVYSLSQPRASKQTPGLPDLWCVHRDQPIAFWWETKRQVGGQHSDEQTDFALECVRCNIPYHTGDRYAAADYLIRLGLAERIGDTLEPVRAA